MTNYVFVPKIGYIFLLSFLKLSAQPTILVILVATLKRQ